MKKTNETDFLLDLFERFGKSDAQAALDFVRRNQQQNVDGVTDGHKEEDVAYQLVDLGLPSGTKWAERNIGAKSEEDVGLYFSWGNTDGHVFGTDYDFDEDVYNETQGAKLEGDIDLEHDSARVNMGEPWRMPTSEEFQELDDNCTHEFCSVNGYRGMRFTSKINGNSIFFPCSGFGYGTTWYYRGSIGYYWSGSLYSATNGRSLGFGSGGVYPQDNNDRFYGFAVRAVQTSFEK